MLDARSGVVLVTSLVLGGCIGHPLKQVEIDIAQENPGVVDLQVNKDVDVLFVIDNSGSMGEEQANLAQNFAPFIQKLEDTGVEANYRIGVTTSDNGNPRCPAGMTTPEGGRLVMSSCTDRINDFIFNNGQVDVRDLACNDICDLDAEALEVLPTTTDLDPEPKPRPWLENIEGRKNIPESTSTADAFRCFGPQGINGCGFESQLESMYLALVRANSTDEASYGFLRDSAILAVVFVTDEADCSYDKDYGEIFSSEGNKVFWSDPSSSIPTSAVCWNAGVECTGDSSNYDACVSANKNVDGQITDDPSQAVLRPMARYTDLVSGIEAQKQAIYPDQEVIVALIGGVDDNGQAHYGDVTDTDPAFQDAFGIGPGCTAPNPFDDPDVEGDELVEAVPPVRLREFTDFFTPGNMFSVCDEDYSPALESIADAIRSQIRPACYEDCARDLDDSTEILEPDCALEQRVPGEDSVRLEECQRDGSGYVVDAESSEPAMPSDDVDVCYTIRVDPGGTYNDDPFDDFSDACLMGNYNLEFGITRRLGVPAPGGTTITATCSVAESPKNECPGLGAG